MQTIKRRKVQSNNLHVGIYLELMNMNSMINRFSDDNSSFQALHNKLQKIIILISVKSFCQKVNLKVF